MFEWDDNIGSGINIIDFKVGHFEGGEDRVILFRV